MFITADWGKFKILVPLALLQKKMYLYSKYKFLSLRTFTVTNPQCADKSWKSSDNFIFFPYHDGSCRYGLKARLQIYIQQYFR